MTHHQGFWLADTACTQALWQAVLGANPSHFKGDDQCPVEQVSWYDVQQFLRKLEALLPGCRADLPTEAEWEYACRAGTDTPFSFGAQISPEQVNYDGNYPYAGGEKGHVPGTDGPGEEPAAQCLGAVTRCTATCWNGAPTACGLTMASRSRTRRARFWKDEEARRAFRGGSWDSDARGRVRPAATRTSRANSSHYQGFRLCLRSIEPQPHPDGSEGAIGQSRIAPHVRRFLREYTKMPDYRRYRVPGGTYFFTVNLLERYPNDLLVRHVDILRSVVRRVREKRPFHIDAWVILPDHLHCVWTLPPGDDDFTNRWRLIKQEFSKALPCTERRSKVRVARGERGIWQRRFWEHAIRDDEDYQAHVDYCHINPLKHGLVAHVADWPHSTFHRYVQSGIYPPDWASAPNGEGSFGERQ